MKLKPCPFCGFDYLDSDDHDVVYPTVTDGSVWSVNCVEYAGGCGASVLGWDKDEAIRNWERRVSNIQT